MMRESEKIILWIEIFGGFLLLISSVFAFLAGKTGIAFGLALFSMIAFFYWIKPYRPLRVGPKGIPDVSVIKAYRKENPKKTIREAIERLSQ